MLFSPEFSIKNGRKAGRRGGRGLRVEQKIKALVFQLAPKKRCFLQCHRQHDKPPEAAAAVEANVIIV